MPAANCQGGSEPAPGSSISNRSKEGVGCDYSRGRKRRLIAGQAPTVERPAASVSAIPFKKFDGVHVGMSESAVLAGWDYIKLDTAGCFGNKHQLVGKQQEITIVITTVDKVIRSVRLLPPPRMVFSLKEARQIALGLLDGSHRREVCHDDDDLVIGDVKQPLEYFYYSDGSRIELTYSNATADLIEAIQVCGG